MRFRLAGIRRKTEFSPNHVENDLSILNLTSDNLKNLGAEITIYDEAELAPDSVKEDVVFSMVQGPLGTSSLQRLSKRRRVLIINSPEGVLNCYRTNMVRLLTRQGIPFPKSVILKTSTGLLGSRKFHTFGGKKVWLKRGDVHAVHREDVSAVYSPDEVRSVLREFRRRGIRSAILQEHLDGDTVKFYSVRESDFFNWYYLNGVDRTPFSVERLRELALRSAEILGLYVYGGDAIISTDGGITIFDINDWPSFAPIRDQAGLEIAKLVFRKAEDFYDGGS
jgi:glutathione synthase/RimK-type ligase-like ATP-grasp enzyme